MFKLFSSIIALLGLIIVGCNNTPTTNKKAEIELSDSCKNAVKFPNAEMTEKMVKSNFTGDLNNYWGDDKTKLDIKHTFKNGELIQSRFYYENGQVQEEYFFKCQSIHGSIKFYYEDGKLKSFIPYSYGRKEGKALLYDSLGNLKESVFFRNDSMIGSPIINDDNNDNNSISDPKNLLAQIKNGKAKVLFHGIITEPFLDIYLTENVFLYIDHGSDIQESYLLVSKFDKSLKSQVIIYKDKSGKQREFEIKKEPAGDGMSDRTYPYRLIIDGWQGGGDSKRMVNWSEYEK
jgi:uncharacterized membrane protein